jgi:ABC-type lipoprotein release transport system permease subunit
MRIAWRNLWRNRTRTLITLASIAFCTAVLVIADGLARGMMVDLERNVTQLFAGEAQIHAHKYRRERSIYQTVTLSDDVVSNLQEQGIEMTPRLFGFGLVSNGPKSAGGSFWGVKPDREESTFELANNIDQGRFIKNGDVGKIVVGRKLAKILNIGLGDELIVVVEAADGSIGAELYNIVGILKSVADGVDRTAVLMGIEDFRNLFALYGDRFHEFAVNTKGAMPPEEVAQKVAAAVPDLEIKSWKELSPTMAEMTEVAGYAIFIVLGIFGLAAGLGVANTVIMSTYERMWEFGVLKAIGTRPWRIIAGVTREVALLALIGCAIGGAIGLATSRYFVTSGINIEAYAEDLTFQGVAFNPIMRADIDPGSVAIALIGMWVLCVVAAFFPALSAARKDPLDAMRNGAR